MPTILLFGTCDTKLEPLTLLHTLLSSHEPPPSILFADVGRTRTKHPLISIPQPSLVGKDVDVSTLARNELITTMATAMSSKIRSLFEKDEIHGIISLGGSGGTALAAQAMRTANLPLGFPKLIVSTMAGGDVSAYVGDSDITLMPSIVDIAGRNPLLTKILTNAAAAIVGMVKSSPPLEAEKKKAVAITMFGVTTPAVTTAQQYLETHGYEVYVFHATGQGGRVMEKLIAEGKIDGVLDITTTELVDELFGGILTAGPDRLTAAAKFKVPQIVSIGATDCINFGPLHTVPEKFKTGERKIVEHNPSVTLVRTTEDECTKLGEVIAEKLKDVEKGLAAVWCPSFGVSALSEQGGPFCDLAADDALVQAIRKGLDGSNVPVKDIAGCALNDKWFIRRMTETLVEMMEAKEKGV